MAAAAILDFAGYEFCGKKLSYDLILGVCINFGANPFKVAELLRLSNFQMAADAILDFCTM